MISHAFKQFLRCLSRVKLWRQKQHGPTVRIVSESNSSRGRLVEVERAAIQQVATWKFIPAGDSHHDLLVCLDRWDPVQVTLRADFDPGSGGPAEPYPSHVVTVIRIARIPGPHGSVRVTCVFHEPMDLVRGTFGGTEIRDTKAKKIVGTVVNGLLKHPEESINWPVLIDGVLDMWDEKTVSRVRGKP